MYWESERSLLPPFPCSNFDFRWSCNFLFPPVRILNSHTTTYPVQQCA